MNSKALFFSCAILVTLWSSANADIAGAVKAQYPEYDGDVILDGDKRHPNSLCLAAFGPSAASWINYSCDVIRCGQYGDVLSQKVPDGSVYVIRPANRYMPYAYAICLNGAMEHLSDVWSPMYD